MGKTKLQYRTQPCRDLATGGASATKRTPRIVNLRTYNTDELVKFALDNNYIEGAKYELAKGIAKGLIEAERALVKAGNAVSIEGWVRYEPRLKGTVDAEKRMLTAKNRLAMGINALKELKLTLDTFSWQCVDADMSDAAGGDTPEPEPTPTPEPLDLTEVQTAGVNVGCVNETALTVLRGDSLPTWNGERDALEVRYDGQSFQCLDIEQDPDGYLEFTIDTTAGEVIDHDGPVVEIYAQINGREGTINAEWKH